MMHALDGLLLSLMHNDVTGVDFFVPFFVWYFLYSYKICMIISSASENAMIHRIFREHGLLVVIDSNVSLVQLFCLPFCKRSL